MIAPRVPSITVITVTPDGYDNIRRTIAHLKAQTIRERIELIVVAPSRARLAGFEQDLAGFLRHEIVEVGPIRSTGVAIAAGIRRATAPVVAYAEEHSYPNARWAEALLEEHARPCGAAGGLIENENPGSLLSWAHIYVDFGPWVAPAAGGEVGKLASHHTSYKTALLKEYGERLGAMLECEGILHADLNRRGITMRLSTEARSSHQNISRLRSNLAASYHGARLYGAARARYSRWSMTRRLAYAAAAPLIPFIVLRRRLATIARNGRGRLIPKLLPILLTLGAVEAFGEATGYLAGEGDATFRRCSFELERHRHLRSGDLSRRPNPAGA
jgi:hypothetical protein